MNKTNLIANNIIASLKKALQKDFLVYKGVAIMSQNNQNNNNNNNNNKNNKNNNSNENKKNNR